jgi:hypothetical protein
VTWLPLVGTTAAKTGGGLIAVCHWKKDEKSMFEIICLQFAKTFPVCTSCNIWQDTIAFQGIITRNWE